MISRRKQAARTTWSFSPSRRCASGDTASLQLQVYGDGSGNFLNIWVGDAGQTWQFTFGRIQHTGWGTMTATFTPDREWPNGPIGEVAEDSLTLPLSLKAFILTARRTAWPPAAQSIWMTWWLQRRRLRRSPRRTRATTAAAAPAAGAAAAGDAGNAAGQAAAAPAATPGRNTPKQQDRLHPLQRPTHEPVDP